MQLVISERLNVLECLAFCPSLDSTINALSIPLPSKWYSSLFHTGHNEINDREKNNKGCNNGYDCLSTVEPFRDHTLSINYMELSVKH